MSLLEKFGAEQGDSHPGPLTWPGSGLGLPILGQAAPNILQSEFEEIDHKCVYRTGTFRTWVDDEMAQYRYVRERASNVGDGGVTWFAIREYERKWDAKQQGWVIWMEWVQVYGVLPKELKAQGGRDAIKEFVDRGRAAEFLAGGAVELYPGAADWEQVEPGSSRPPAPPPEALPSGVRPPTDPFAPRRNRHGR